MNISDFFRKMAGDESLRAGLGKLHSKDDMVRFLNQNGCYTTKEKLEAFFNPHTDEDGALDDEALNKVAGGVSIFGNGRLGCGYCPVCGAFETFAWDGMTFCQNGRCRTLVYTVAGRIVAALSFGENAGGVLPEPGCEMLREA